MKFIRNDFATELEQWRMAGSPDSRRAQGDNLAFEENVGDARRDDFEAGTKSAASLGAALGGYFKESVQGEARRHTPSTFLPLNGPALMSPGIERTQKIVRLEGIDAALIKDGIDFNRLSEAVAGGDGAVMARLIRMLNRYSGARPAFACFKTEVSADLKEPDWAARLIARLGLGHWALAPGETGRFALMEYTVEEVFAQAKVTTPFTVPTVLETRNSEHFFPAPKGSGYGYTVDLHPGQRAGRSTVREMLHIRLTYQEKHLVRVAELQGPMVVFDLAEARDAHLERLRKQCARPDYGAMMAGRGTP